MHLSRPFSNHSRGSSSGVLQLLLEPACQRLDVSCDGDKVVLVCCLLSLCPRTDDYTRLFAVLASGLVHRVERRQELWLGMFRRRVAQNGKGKVVGSNKQQIWFSAHTCLLSHLPTPGTAAISSAFFTASAVSICTIVMSVSLADLRYSGVVIPCPKAVNGDPCPLTPRGGNLEDLMTSSASAAVLTIGTINALVMSVHTYSNLGQWGLALEANVLRSGVQRALDEGGVCASDPDDGRNSASGSRKDGIVHIVVADVSWRYQ